MNCSYICTHISQASSDTLNVITLKLYSLKKSACMVRVSRQSSEKERDIETVDLLRFSQTAVSRVYTKWWRKQHTHKTSVVMSGSSVDGDERGQRRTASHTLSWREGYINFNNHCVQLCWAEKRLRRINMPHLGADGLQQQKTMSYFTPVSEEQEAGAMVGWRKTLEKGHLVF